MKSKRVWLNKSMCLGVTLGKKNKPLQTLLITDGYDHWVVYLDHPAGRVEVCLAKGKNIGKRTKLGMDPFGFYDPSVRPKT